MSALRLTLIASAAAGTPRREQHARGLSALQLSLARGEAKVTSQGRQDGVLRTLFETLGTTNKQYVEFGFNSATYEGGSGANTLQLQRAGWSGLLMDGGYRNSTINLHQEVLGPHRIVDLLRKHDVPHHVDYMSIDFDSYDVWTFRSVIRSPWRPRVLTVEYNPCFPYNSTLALQYPDSDGFWNPKDKVFGSSLGALDLVARENGYTMVYVISGLDAFFVRDDVLFGRAVTPLAQLPPDRLVEAIYAPDGSWQRYPAALNEQEQFAPLTLGGHRVGHLMGWWPKKMPKDGHTARQRTMQLEDVAVFLHTGDHAAARLAASKSAYATHLLTLKW